LITDNSDEYLIFDVAKQPCALPVADVWRILPMAWLSLPPDAPPFLEGFLDWRGFSLPVVRVTRLFQLPDQPLDRFTPLIVLKSEADRAVALLVDRTRMVASIERDELQRPPADHSLGGCVKAYFRWKAESVFLLSPQKLFLEEERRRLDHFRAAEALRLQQANSR
jgi:chemotaxis signal transduction protein